MTRDAVAIGGGGGAKRIGCPLGVGSTYARTEATPAAITSGRTMPTTKRPPETVATRTRNHVMRRDRRAKRKFRSSGTTSSSSRSTSSLGLRRRPDGAQGGSSTCGTCRGGGDRTLSKLRRPGNVGDVSILGGAAGAEPAIGGGGIGTLCGGKGGGHDRGRGARPPGPPLMTRLIHSGSCAARPMFAAEE
jgi:hypothetical protein